MGEIKRASFIVRATEDGGGRITGVIERVSTGAKEAFSGLEAIGQVIRRMLGSDGLTPEAPPPIPSDPPRPDAP